jgi:hypothetical protein
MGYAKNYHDNRNNFIAIIIILSYRYHIISGHTDNNTTLGSNFVVFSIYLLSPSHSMS